MSKELLRRVSLLAVISVIGAPLAALSATDNATLTVGRGTLPACSFNTHLSGYKSGTFGSYSPTGLTGGKTVTDVFDVDNCNIPQSSVLSVSGFSVDPGHLWLTSITCNGATKTAASASFSYSSGTASWSWSSTFGFYSETVGTNDSCSITHN